MVIPGPVAKPRGGIVQLLGDGINSAAHQSLLFWDIQNTAPHGGNLQGSAPSVRFLCILLKITLKPTFRRCLCCIRSSKHPLPTKLCLCWSYVEEMMEIEVIPNSPNLPEFRIPSCWVKNLAGMHETPLVLRS